MQSPLATVKCGEGPFSIHNAFSVAAAAGASPDARRGRWRRACTARRRLLPTRA